MAGLHAADVGRSRTLTLESGSRRFPILALGRDSCLIAVEGDVALRGFADIFDGERHVEHCLIVLAAPEGEHLRCFFKHRTPWRPGPPADYAP